MSADPYRDDCVHCAELRAEVSEVKGKLQSDRRRQWTWRVAWLASAVCFVTFLSLIARVVMTYEALPSPPPAPDPPCQDTADSISYGELIRLCKKTHDLVIEPLNDTTALVRCVCKKPEVRDAGAGDAQ